MARRRGQVRNLTKPATTRAAQTIPSGQFARDWDKEPSAGQQISRLPTSGTKVTPIGAGCLCRSKA